MAALPSGEAWRVANDPNGIDAVALQVAASQPELVGLEATGGHEHAVAAALAAADLPVATTSSTAPERAL